MVTQCVLTRDAAAQKWSVQICASRLAQSIDGRMQPANFGVGSSEDGTGEGGGYNFCNVCHGAGSLLLCDSLHCAYAAHADRCLGLSQKEIAEIDAAPTWFCKACRLRGRHTSQ